MYIFATPHSLMPHMQIAARFSLALAATGLVIFSTNGLIQVEKERHDLLDFFEQRMRAIGAAAQCAASGELRGESSDEGSRALEAMSRIEPGSRGVLVDVRGQPIAPYAAVLDPLDQRA